MAEKTAAEATPVATTPAPVVESKGGGLAGLDGISSEAFLDDMYESGDPTIDPPPASDKPEDVPADDLSLTDEQKKALEDEKKDKGGEGATGAPIDPEAAKNKAAEDKKAADDAAIADAAAVKAVDDKIVAAEAKLKGAKTDADKKAAQAEVDSAKLEKEELAPPPPVVMELKNPGDDKPEGAAGADPEEYSWKELAKTRNIEITEDTQEAYDKAIDQLIADAKEIPLSKFKPEAQRFIEFLEAGGTVDAFVEPTKKVDSYLALADVDLIAADLEARSWDQAKIDKEINRLTEADQVDVAAQKLRDVLSAKRADIVKTVQDNTISMATKAKDRMDKAFITESKEIRSSLDKMPTFMDTPISAKNRELIQKKYEKGEYDAAFKKPDVLAKFLMYLEFGAQAEGNLKAKAREDAFTKYKRDRHNIPPTPDGGGAGATKRTATNQSQKAEGNWGALPEMVAE